MPNILNSIELIIEKFVEGNLQEAVAEIHQLCKNNAELEGYSAQARTLFSQLNEFEDKWFKAIIGTGEADLERNKIKDRFNFLVDKIKKELNPSSTICYEQQAKSIKMQKEQLREKLIMVEDDLLLCEMPEKSELLENIRDKIILIFEHFDKLYLIFLEVKKHE